MAYCAYCKAKIFNLSAKCPNCGSTAFLPDASPLTGAEDTLTERQTVYVEKPVYVERPVYIERPVYVEREVIRVRESDKSWVVALVLCLFFGYLGFHRFYVGKIGSGLGYLFTFGWFGLGWLADCIVILTGGFRDHYGLPLPR